MKCSDRRERPGWCPARLAHGRSSFPSSRPWRTATGGLRTRPRRGPT